MMGGMTTHKDIYPEMVLNKTNISDDKAKFLDLDILLFNSLLLIISLLRTTVYDKRNDFGF